MAILVASCSTPTALYNNAHYDASVVEAIKKLRKKKKKRKHVEIVESAFRKVTQQDMDRIARLKAEGRPSNWVEINRIHNEIKDRQDLISPYLPLYSKDGYKANFQFVKILPLERESRKMAAEYYYNEGKMHLAKGEQGFKYAARKAYGLLNKTNRYFDQYKDVAVLKDRAVELGRNHVLFTVQNESNTFLPKDFEEGLYSINLQNRDNLWTRYFSDASARSDFDFEVSLRLRNVDISPQLVNNRRYVDQKEIEDGFDYVLDNNGNVLKDSLGNDVKTVRYTTIEAWVDEVHQHKAATLEGRVIFKDLAKNTIIRNDNIQVTAIFENYAATFNGDRRALSRDSRNRIGNVPMPFPSDESLMYDALDNLQPALEYKIDVYADMASL